MKKLILMIIVLLFGAFIAGFEHTDKQHSEKNTT